jgi:pimeloyl-ACP methyl ester carboxylesterase
MNEQFDAFGHSAGAQFAHRLLLFKPDLPVDGMVASASGWYTVPDPGIDFPYGLGQSPAESANMSLYFGEALTVMVGALDTDPNSFDLRHNEWADAQGLQRVERAQHFYNRGAKLAGGIGAEFYWTYAEVPGVGHEFAPLAAAAVEILY